jgi:tetratricopeptide (TPR) repeat protein
VAYFEQAIEHDSAYALAYSGLADAYTLLSAGYYGNMPAMRAVTHALPAAQRALELAPDLAEAHASLGLIHHNQGDLVAAQAALERALALNPGYTMAHVWHGLVLTTQGRYRDAEVRNREALRLDPSRRSPIRTRASTRCASAMGPRRQPGSRWRSRSTPSSQCRIPAWRSSIRCMAHSRMRCAGSTRPSSVLRRVRSISPARA